MAQSPSTHTPHGNGLSYGNIDGIMLPNTPKPRDRSSLLFPTPNVRSPPFRPQGSLRRDSLLFPSNSSAFSGESYPEVSLGDLVEVPGGWHGHVMYVGPVEGRQGTFLGVDLIALDADKGRNNGTYNNISYFSTKTSTSGMFVPQGRCRIIEHNARKEQIPTTTRPASRQQLNIRPNSRMRNSSARSFSNQSQGSHMTSLDTGTHDDSHAAAIHQKLLNDTARLNKECEDLRRALKEEQNIKAVHAQEMEELLSTIAELEALQSPHEHEQNLRETRELKAYIADREKKIEELRSDAELRRTEFKQATEHQEATIEELKSLHRAQIIEWQERHQDIESRLLSSGDNTTDSQSPTRDEMELLQAQLSELSDELDALVEQQERARQDIEIAHGRIAELEQENNRLMEDLDDARNQSTAARLTDSNSDTAIRNSEIMTELSERYQENLVTVTNLEKELRLLRAERDGLLSATDSRRRQEMESDEHDKAELQESRAMVESLKAEREEYQHKDREFERLKAALKSEEDARKMLQMKHEQMEDTLEQTIMHMNSKSPRSSRQFRPDTAEPLPKFPTTPTKKPKEDLRSPRTDRGSYGDLPSEGNLWCEYCEMPGHDIVSCKAVFGSASATPAKTSAAKEENGNLSIPKSQTTDDFEDIMY